MSEHKPSSLPCDILKPTEYELAMIELRSPGMEKVKEIYDDILNRIEDRAQITKEVAPLPGTHRRLRGFRLRDTDLD